jgi:ABC-type Fe3+-hydroxamate transport system substrate-binding protein
LALLSPALCREQLPTPGDLTQVNIESLLALHPQVVFVPPRRSDDSTDSERRDPGGGYFVAAGEKTK